LRVSKLNLGLFFKVFSFSFNASGGDVFVDGSELLVKVLSKLFDDGEFSGNLGLFSLVFSGLVLTPGSLGGKGSLDVLELDLVTLKGLGELSEEGLGGVDQGGKSGLLVGEGLLLVLEGGEESLPVVLGLLFVGVGDFLLGDDIFSDVIEEL